MKHVGVELQLSVNEKVLHEIASIVGGPGAEAVVKQMSDGKETTIENLALKSGVQINQVRKILYRLYSRSLVTSKRFRDPETGWFIFQWKLQPELVEGYVQSTKQKIVKRLQARLEYEESRQFYHCGNECPKLSFDEAMEAVFHCPKCGRILRLYDNKAVIEALERKIREIEVELNDSAHKV